MSLSACMQSFDAVTGSVHDLTSSRENCLLRTCSAGRGSVCHYVICAWVLQQRENLLHQTQNVKRVLKCSCIGTPNFKRYKSRNPAFVTQSLY
jgi:hypothetical protein